MSEKKIEVVSGNLVDHSERAAKVSQLAGELSQVMATAFRDGMSLGDVVYAGGLGVNGFSRIAAMMIGDPGLTEEYMAEQNRAIVTEALGAQVCALRVDTVEQARQLTGHDPDNQTVN